MKYILWMLVIIAIPLNAAKVTALKWKEGQTFSQYLESKQIPAGFLDTISKEDQKFLTEINTKYDFFELVDDRGSVSQVLIPISSVMQIHISKNKQNNRYAFDIIPIVYNTGEYYAKVMIDNNPYTDTLNGVKNENVANRLSSALNGAIDGKKLHKEDEINFIYTQKRRMGKPFLMPNIKVARVKMRDKEQFIYVDEDGDGFTQLDKSVAYKVKGKKKKYIQKEL